MSTKPTEVVEWATDEGATQVEPDSGDKETGFVPATPADPQHVNWLIAKLGLWSVYLRDGMLDGAFGLKAFITPSTISGTNSDYAPTDHATAVVIRQGLSAAATLTGLAGPADGRIVTIVNLSGTYDLKLAHDVTSTSTNRFSLPDAKDLYLVGAQSYATLWYDTTLDRWTVVATNGRQPKEIWIPGSDFNDSDYSDANTSDAGIYTNANGSSAIGIYAPIPLPVGTRITAVAATTQRQSTAGNRQFALHRGDLAGSTVTISSNSTSDVSGTYTKSLSSSLPHTMLDYPYSIQATIYQDATFFEGFLGCKVTYY